MGHLRDRIAELEEEVRLKDIEITYLTKKCKILENYFNEQRKLLAGLKKTDKIVLIFTIVAVISLLAIKWIF